jgi:ATP-dependent Zn protease
MLWLLLTDAVTDCVIELLCCKCSESTVKFSDVIGCDEAKSEVQQIVDFIKAPQRYTDLGASTPR